MKPAPGNFAPLYPHHPHTDLCENEVLELFDLGRLGDDLVLSVGKLGGAVHLPAAAGLLFARLHLQTVLPVAEAAGRRLHALGVEIVLADCRGDAAG